MNNINTWGGCVTFYCVTFICTEFGKIQSIICPAYTL